MRIGFALWGIGTVGGQVYDYWLKERQDAETRAGGPLDLISVLKRQTGAGPARRFGAPFTPEPEESLSDSRVHIIVSALGDNAVEPALIKRALQAGKRVVTASKFAIATYGNVLYQTAREYNTELFAEATVGGGVQIVDQLQTRIGGGVVEGIYAINNGTTNKILTLIAENGWSYARALREAQRLGFAERDPGSDVLGYDAAYKIAIMAGILANGFVSIDQIPTRGILGIHERDHVYARTFGYAIKLIASLRFVERSGKRKLELWVGPALVKQGHKLYDVRHEDNGFLLYGPRFKENLISGPGAGGGPTAFSMWNDIVNAAQHIRKNGYLQPMPDLSRPAEVISPDEIENQHYLRVTVQDKKGTIKEIGAVCESFGASVSGLLQPVVGEWEDEAEMVIITDRNREGDIKRLTKALMKSPRVLEVGSILRVLQPHKATEKRTHKIRRRAPLIFSNTAGK